MTKPANGGIHITFTTAQTIPPSVGVWIQRDITIDLTNGLVSGYYGNHASGGDPANSVPFSFSLSAAELKKVWKIVVDNIQASGIIAAGTEDTDTKGKA
jgi:hypothetical protein